MPQSKRKRSKRGTLVDEDCNVPPGSFVGNPVKMYASRCRDLRTEVFPDTSAISHIVKVPDIKVSLQRHSLLTQQRLHLLQVTFSSAPSLLLPLRWQFSRHGWYSSTREGNEDKTKSIHYFRDIREPSYCPTEMEVNQEMDGVFQLT